GHAYHAPDVVPLAAQKFASVPAEGLARMRVKLHPSVSIISSRHPVYSIWYANQDIDRYVPIAPWAPEAALVARPDLDVEVHKLPAGGAAFVTALAQGGTFADAFVAATDADEKFDPVASLSLIIRANVVVGFGKRSRGVC